MLASFSTLVVYSLMGHLASGDSGLEEKEGGERKEERRGESSNQQGKREAGRLGRLRQSPLSTPASGPGRRPQASSGPGSRQSSHSSPVTPVRVQSVLSVPLVTQAASHQRTGEKKRKEAGRQASRSRPSIEGKGRAEDPSPSESRDCESEATKEKTRETDGRGQGKEKSLRVPQANRGRSLARSVGSKSNARDSLSLCPECDVVPWLRPGPTQTESEGDSDSV